MDANGGRGADASHDRLASMLAGDDLAFAESATTVDHPFVADDADADDVFPQSVASGGPTPTGVILWTRLAPDAFDPEVGVGVEVAHDPDFDDVVYRGVVDDADRVATHDHTLKIDLDGHLDPDSRYHYRFVHDGVASRTGRCRTLPAPDASLDSLRLAVLACQNYVLGYYGALSHVAEEDVDFVLHVGDFVYESCTDCFTGLGSREYPDRDLSLPNGTDRVRDLTDYRAIYRAYREDEHLQRLQERHTFVPAWDDHELVNDVHWDPETGAPAGDHPRGDDPEFMTNLVADALHAWWEYMPARLQYDPDADHLHERFQLWRSLQFGDLVDLTLTDERLYRSPPRETLPTRGAIDPEQEPADRTMLGGPQREWLVDRLTDDTARWSVWADEVLTIPYRLGFGRASLFPVQGGWDGYTRERRAVSRAIAADPPRNLVTLTGDMHAFLAGYKQTEYAVLGDDPGERLGVEFMAPPTTSLNVAEALGLSRGLRARLTEPILTGLSDLMNPHLEYLNAHRWGYSVVEFTRDDCTYLGYAVDKEDPEDPDRELLIAMRVPDGRVQLQDVTEDRRRRVGEN
ncbi:alkaline phosphatase D family protein [Halomarina salina]|uniref:Alkaline phosphatase D family protein n=1 Tax=Halomarina salina TaxID=1872699 RepID=A0ABD5RKT2_9EURY|nr:alkaline phosphatase D family protein [Halomarina salina]